MNRTAAARQVLDLRLGAIVGLALVAGVLSFLLLDPTDVGDSSVAGGEVATSVPVIKSANELRDLATATGHPIYWAGEQPGFRYEVTKTVDGRIYVRYLPPEVNAGDPRLGFTFVGTYPQSNALATVRAATHRRGGRGIALGAGGLAVVNGRLPRVLYAASPNSDYLVEVFDRSPQRARSLITSGQVAPIR
jgi:hypothetical protein